MPKFAGQTVEAALDELQGSQESWWNIEENANWWETEENANWWDTEESANWWDRHRADSIPAVNQEQVVNGFHIFDASTSEGCDTADEVIESVSESSQDWKLEDATAGESNATLQSRIDAIEAIGDGLQHLDVAKQKEMELADAHAIARLYKTRVQYMAWETFTNKILQQATKPRTLQTCLVAEISRLNKHVKCQRLMLDKERDQRASAEVQCRNYESLQAENSELKKALKAKDYSIRKVRAFASMEEEYPMLEAKTVALEADLSKAEAELLVVKADVSALEEKRSKIQQISQLDAAISKLKADLSALEANKSKRLHISELETEISKLEARASQHRKAASLEAEIEQCETRLSQIGYFTKSAVDSIIAGADAFSSILQKPLAENRRCSSCMCKDKLSSLCRRCCKSTCISCIERNLEVQSKSGSIDEKRKAARLECFNCKAGHDSRLPVFFSHGGLEDYFAVKAELAQFELDKSRNMRSERAKKLQELSVQPREEKTLWLERMIVKDMRTLACPACATPFESFSGCTALTCAGCNAHFCAWCLALADDERECHRHVRDDCPSNQNPGDFFAREEVWRAYTDRRLNHQVEQYIAKLEAPISRRLRSDFRWALESAKS